MRTYILIGFLLFSEVLTALANTAVPSLVNYQGLMTDENGIQIPDGPATLEFNLYDAPIGGNRVWGPQRFEDVPIRNGRFNVILGPTDIHDSKLDSAFSSSDRFLSIRVGATPDSVDLSPRQQILSAPFALSAANGIPAGTILPFAGNEVPSGFLICAGQAVGRSTFARLFAAIGTTYGAGDGTTSFNLPNLAGRFVAGTDPAEPALSTLGQAGGESKHVLTYSEMPIHSHGDITDWEVTEAAFANENVGNPGDRLAVSNAGRRSGNRYYSQLTTSNAGQGAPHNNLPPYVTMHYIIKF